MAFFALANAPSPGEYFYRYDLNPTLEHRMRLYLQCIWFLVPVIAAATGPVSMILWLFLVLDSIINRVQDDPICEAFHTIRGIIWIVCLDIVPSIVV